MAGERDPTLTPTLSRQRERAKGLDPGRGILASEGMASTLRIALAGWLLTGSAWAQPVPPRPPAAPPARPQEALRPVRPAPARPTAARPPPARPTPVVPARPGPAARPAPHRPVPQRPAPRPVPVPVPTPAPEPERPAAPTKGSNSGQMLPRFAALRSDEVYMRSGPGPRYPIEWVYKRRDLPLEIEREFDIWRLVRDQEGVRGWVNTQTLSPRRTAVVTGGERVLRRDPRDDATPVATLKPGVIVRLRSCDAASDWCQTQVQDYRGWMKRSDVWGTYPGEAIQ